MTYMMPSVQPGYSAQAYYAQAYAQRPAYSAYPASSYYPAQTAYQQPSNAWQAPARAAYPPAQAYYYPARVNKVAAPTPAAPFQNRLKEMFHNRQAVTYALHLRTFAAKDKNGDGKIDPTLGENGNFLRAIPLLTQLKELGVNNIHLLPINPVGKLERLGDFGSPGSAYAPEAYNRLNEEYDEPNNGLSVEQEARMFVEACHKLGIHVMVDVPSCASVDLANARPDLLSRDINGKPLTPTNWVDIRMFVKDTPALRDYFQQFFDLMVDKVGVDGFRVDVARARTMDFWRHFIGKYRDKAWLAETYTEEDASPLKNIPRDVPEDLLKAGFDSIYGQFHIFHDMDANQYTRYLLQNRQMLKRVGQEKSLIGSFLTHDDPSTMKHGGSLFCRVISGLMATQPDTNPYILDGFLTGYRENYDIFNWRPRPTGKHPEIGRFLQKMIQLRQSPEYGPALTVGKFIPLRVEQDARDSKVIAFLRQHQGRTVLVVANKDVNAAHSAAVELPGLNPRQQLNNLAPSYGEPSQFVVDSGKIQMKLERGRFYMFDLALPSY
jgi:hypothetical protein